MGHSYSDLLKRLLVPWSAYLSARNWHLRRGSELCQRAFMAHPLYALAFPPEFALPWVGVGARVRIWDQGFFIIIEDMRPPWGVGKPTERGAAAMM